MLAANNLFINNLKIAVIYFPKIKIVQKRFY